MMLDPRKVFASFLIALVLISLQGMTLYSRSYSVRNSTDTNNNPGLAFDKEDAVSREETIRTSEVSIETTRDNDLIYPSTSEDPLPVITTSEVLVTSEDFSSSEFIGVSSSVVEEEVEKPLTDQEKIDAISCPSFLDYNLAFDVVVPFINTSNGERTYADIGSGRIPFSDIVFCLRALNKYGMMAQARYVWILYDDTLHEPPTFLNTSVNSKVRLLPHSRVLKDRDDLKGKRWHIHVVLSSLYKVDALLNHFFIVHDDMYLVQPFNISRYYENDKSIQYLMKTVYLSPKFYCKFNGRGVKELAKAANWFAIKDLYTRLGTEIDIRLDEHTPTFTNKCLLKNVAEIMENVLQCNYNVRSSKGICVYLHYHFYLTTQNVAVLANKSISRHWTEVSKSVWPHNFFQNMTIAERIINYKPAVDEYMWLNIQGSGASDETHYERSEEARIIIDEWLFSEYPTKMPWEITNWELWKKRNEV